MFTVILYLTDDVDSTAFPVFKVGKFAVPEFAAADEHTVTNAAAMQVTVQRGCLEKERYVRWPVRVGDMALFMQSTMHFGTQNTVTQERQALFSVLTPFDGMRQDDYQIYRSGTAAQAEKKQRHSLCSGSVRAHTGCFGHVPLVFRRSWMYVGYAYGVQSRELAQAVWRDRDFQPLDRFSANAAGRQSKQAYVASLLRWGVLRSWNPRARTALDWADEAEHRSKPHSEAQVERLYRGQPQH